MYAGGMQAKRNLRFTDKAVCQKRQTALSFVVREPDGGGLSAIASEALIKAEASKKEGQTRHAPYPLRTYRAKGARQKISLRLETLTGGFDHGAFSIDTRHSFGRRTAANIPVNP